MIVVDKPLNLEISEGIKSNNFRIKASKKAFEILSSGLYANKTKAILRELCTNAVDSHVVAGKGSEPIQVHLPNNMEPYFSVKDNGVGLSPHQIDTVYTTYFESDKTNTNDLTGCLGLGSKSPFAYTDQFTVESRFAGVEYTYNAHINEEGMPAIALLGERPTTECNGVTIKFAVKSSDFYEFSREAAETLCWFTVKPTIVGKPNFTFEKHEYMRQTAQYGLTKTKQYQSYVVMGNVAYPVSSSDIRHSRIELTDLECKVLDWGCDLFVPIGTLDVTANREKVSYDVNSVSVLKSCLTAAVEDIKKEVETIITKSPTLWQARRALHDAKHSILGQIKNLMEVMWQGQKIESHVKIKSSKYGPTVTPQNFIEDVVPEVECEKLTLRNTKFKKNGTDIIHADGEVIIWNDLPHGGYIRAINWLTENHSISCYLLNHASQEFMDATGIGEVALRTSKMPKPERVKRTTVPRRAGTKAKLNEYIPNNRSNVCAEHWQATEIDLNDGGVYVEIAYFRFKRKEGFCHPKDLTHRVELFRKLGYEKKIYGIRANDIKVLAKHKNWVSLDNFTQKVLDDNTKLCDIVNKIQQWGELEEHSHVLCFFKSISELSANSLFGQFLTKARECQAALGDEKAKAYNALTLSCNHPRNTDEDLFLTKLRDKVYEKYPLLQYLNWWHDRDTEMKNQIIAYVKMLDSQV